MPINWTISTAFLCSVTCLCCCKRKCFGVPLHVLKLFCLILVKLNCPARDDSSFFDLTRQPFVKHLNVKAGKKCKTGQSDLCSCQTDAAMPMTWQPQASVLDCRDSSDKEAFCHPGWPDSSGKETFCHPVARKLFAILNDKIPVSRKLFTLLWQWSFSLSCGKEAFCHPEWQDSSGKDAFCPPVARKLFAILDDLTPVARKLFAILDNNSNGKEAFCPPVARKLFAILDDLTPVARKLFAILDDNSNGKEAFCPPVARKLFAILDDQTPVARMFFTILDDDSSGNKFFLPAWTTRLRWQGSFSTSWMTCSAWQPVCREFSFESSSTRIIIMSKPHFVWVTTDSGVCYQFIVYIYVCILNFREGEKVKQQNFNAGKVSQFWQV